MDELWELSKKNKFLLEIGGHWIEKCPHIFVPVIFMYVQWNGCNLLLTEYFVRYKMRQNLQEEYSITL
jgi:hypothetical protein